MTDIEWTNETWNPIVGCSLESPGCTNCYAMRKANRLAEMGKHTSHYRGLVEKHNGKPVWNGVVREAPERLLMKPFRWKKGKMIFVNSMGDLFHESVPDHAIDKVFAVMALCPQHTFQVLTKRAERMREYMADIDARGDAINGYAGEMMHWDEMPQREPGPLSNVWLGVSAEDQTRADARIPHLLATPAAVRFVSCEPLLGAIDLTDIPWPKDRPKFPETDDISDSRSALRVIENTKLDWVIAGGESGPGARPPHPDWFRSLRDQCQQADVPFFFKQWGSWGPERPPNYYPPGNKGGKPSHQSAALMPDGSRYRPSHPDDWQTATTMYLARKENTGATLDGREHREWPDISAERAA